MTKIAIIDTETNGLNALEHELLGIGYGIFSYEKMAVQDIKVDVIEDITQEKQLLERFWAEARDFDMIVGFNLDFDWGFLKLKSLRHRVKLRHFRKYQTRTDLRVLLNEDKYAKADILQRLNAVGFLLGLVFLVS